MAESSGGTISADRLREITGLTDRSHRLVAEKGYFPQPIKGQYQLGATLKGLFRYYRELQQKRSDATKLHEERLKAAKADIAEDERDRGRELYVLKQLIGPALRAVAIAQKALLRRKLEQELPARLAHKEAGEILAANRAAVDEICAAFCDGVRGWMGSEEEQGPDKVTDKVTD